MTKARELAELGKAVSVHDNRLDFDRAVVIPGLIDAAGTTTIADGSVTTAKIADDAVTTAKVDTNITVAGTLDVTGDLSVTQYIRHVGDTDTHLKFGDNTIELFAGNVNILQGVSNEVIINQGGADVNFRVEGDNQANLFVVDAGNDRVGIGTSSPADLFHAYLNSGQRVARFEANNTTSAHIGFKGSNTSLMPTIGVKDEDLYLSTGDAVERMRIDASGNVGIGTSSPSSYYSTELVISTSDNGGITLANTNTSHASYIMFADGTSGSDQYRGQFGYDHNINAMVFHTDVTERMRIDSTGRVQIGTSNVATDDSMLTLQKSSTAVEFNIISSPSHASVINLGDTGDYNICRIKGDNSNNSLQFQTNNAERMRIDSSGRVAIGSTSITASADFDDLQIGSNGGTSGLTILSSGSATAGIAFADPAESVAHSLVCHHADNSMRFNVNGNTERMRINSSGSVGIGVTPETTFAQKKALRLSATASLIAGGAYYPYPYYVANNLYYDSSDNLKYIASSGGAMMSVNAHLGGRFQFYTAASGTAGATANITERMRIDSSGNISIGTTSSLPQTGGSAFRAESLSRRTLIMSQSGTGAANIIIFYSGGNLSGAINIQSGSVSYGSGSDYRIKENIVDLTDATTRLKQLQPKRFNFITDSDDQVRDGFLAHEVSSIVPEAVIGEKDAVDENDEIIVQQLDQSKLVPLLVKTIQELEARITELENK